MLLKIQLIYFEKYSIFGTDTAMVATNGYRIPSGQDLRTFPYIYRQQQELPAKLPNDEISAHRRDGGSQL